MTDNEIIKGLECCGIRDTKCISCPYYEKTYCVDVDALDLINRQKAEIDILIRKKESLRDEIAEQQAEIERLTNKCEDCAGCNQWKCDCANERTYAIEKFANLIKRRLNCNTPRGAYLIDIVDNLVKEMVGDNNV